MAYVGSGCCSRKYKVESKTLNRVLVCCCCIDASDKASVRSSASDVELLALGVESVLWDRVALCLSTAEVHLTIDITSHEM